MCYFRGSILGADSKWIYGKDDEQSLHDPDNWLSVLDVHLITSTKKHMITVHCELITNYIFTLRFRFENGWEKHPQMLALVQTTATTQGQLRFFCCIKMGDRAKTGTKYAGQKWENILVSGSVSSCKFFNQIRCYLEEVCLYIIT